MTHVKVGSIERTFEFDTASSGTQRGQLIVDGEKIDPSTQNTVVFSQEGAAPQFASASWHFSTEALPKAAHSSFLSVRRSFFRRATINGATSLTPIREGAQVRIGDEIEVQLELSTEHEAEFIHLRDPRGAGFEPVALRSGYRWQDGLSHYQEVRDTGMNFFFEKLPAGRYLFRHRLRANMTGDFRVAPAVISSLYAPSLTAYSSGRSLNVR